MAAINDFSFSKMICQTTEVRQVPANGFKVLSSSNALVDCNHLKTFNLEPWKEQHKIINFNL